LLADNLLSLQDEQIRTAIVEKSLLEVTDEKAKQ